MQVFDRAWLQYIHEVASRDHAGNLHAQRRGSPGSDFLNYYFKVLHSNFHSMSVNLPTPLWKYCERSDLKGRGGNANVQCTLCQANWQGSYTRVKAHFMHIPGKGVGPCKGPTDKLAEAQREQKRADAVALSRIRPSHAGSLCSDESNPSIAGGLEKDKLEKEIQEKENHLQQVVHDLGKLYQEKRLAKEENANSFVKSGALEHGKLEKPLGEKQKENIICSLQETVQALQEKLGDFEQQQREFQTLVKREVQREAAQIRSALTGVIHSTLTELLGLDQREDPVAGAQKLIKDLREHKKMKCQSRSNQFMLVVSPDVQQSKEEAKSNNKGLSSHMDGDKGTGARSHLLLTRNTEALHCSICMEDWTTAGDHRICSLACGHMFGMSCIRKWLQRQDNNIGKCPQCNDNAELRDIRILYVPVIAVTGLE